MRILKSDRFEMVNGIVVKHIINTQYEIVSNRLSVGIWEIGDTIHLSLLINKYGFHSGGSLGEGYNICKKCNVKSEKYKTRNGMIVEKIPNYDNEYVFKIIDKNGILESEDGQDLNRNVYWGDINVDGFWAGGSLGSEFDIISKYREGDDCGTTEEKFYNRTYDISSKTLLLKGCK